jgi:hypothetical protein
MLVVPMYDVALAMTAVVIVLIDFPYDVFGVLLISVTSRQGSAFSAYASTWSIPERTGPTIAPAPTPHAATYCR